MNKYTIMFIVSFSTFLSFVLFFDSIASITREMMPFIGVLLFGLLMLLSIILRVGVWYRKDLAKRTMDELDRINKEDVDETAEN
jgi:hypothetical protein